MDYIPHDQAEIKEILQKIGISQFIELYKDIPQDLLLKKLNLPEGLSESDLSKSFTALSKKNHQYSTAFLGAGCYYHYIPSLVDYVISLSPFYSAYTPYQAEASQGMLQSIYEYQSAICRLTQLDVTNASMYDGASACAEACIMAYFVNRKKKKKILFIEGLHPHYIETAQTYLWGRNLESEIIPLSKLEEKLTDNVAGIVIQSPNFYGEIEDIGDFVLKVRELSPKCLIIQAMTDPSALGKLLPPGKLGVDVFVAEGIGLTPSFGGPNLGIFATTKKLMRYIPGRLIGRTKEINGDKEGFVLTLQAREQHIRREKAQSNICSNQSLCMIANLVYLVSMGKTGLEQIAIQNFQKANFVKQSIATIPGYHILNTKPTYNEFVVKCPNADKFIQKLKKADILPPLKLDKFFPERKNEILVCVTEQNSKEDIEKFLKIAEDVL
ncbi:MAG: aminomethyl-transferring glycine dehydrogenase subunit GcvPA [Promethearchaeota archaeon]